MIALKDALLEIGSEELPSSFIGLGMRQLKALAEASLQEHKLGFQSLVVYGTPRRLAIVIQGVAERSEDQSKSLSGPPEAIAKDAQGGWTPAALGFARKNNLKPADLRM
jgi:glycyl-tRNA synthetase beta chain